MGFILLFFIVVFVVGCIVIFAAVGDEPGAGLLIFPLMFITAIATIVIGCPIQAAVEHFNQDEIEKATVVTVEEKAVLGAHVEINNEGQQIILWTDENGDIKTNHFRNYDDSDEWKVVITHEVVEGGWAFWAGNPEKIEYKFYVPTSELHYSDKE